MFISPRLNWTVVSRSSVSGLCPNPNPRPSSEHWPVTLTYKFDLDRLKSNHLAKYLGRRLFGLKVITTNIHADTHTHTKPIAQSGPLNWGAKSNEKDTDERSKCEKLLSGPTYRQRIRSRLHRNDVTVLLLRLRYFLIFWRLHVTSLPGVRDFISPRSRRLNVLNTYYDSSSLKQVRE